MTFLKLEQFMKILYPDSISGYPDIRILYPDIRILYPKLVCFGYHFLENLPMAGKSTTNYSTEQTGVLLFFLPLSLLSILSMSCG